MSSQLGTQKRLLTTFTNKLEHIVTSLRNEKLHEIVIEPHQPQEARQESISRLEEGVSAISSASSKVETVLAQYASILDKMESKSTKETEDYENYAAKAESALFSAFDLSVLLEARIRALTSSASNIPSVAAINSAPTMNQTQAKPLELPPLPIPTFGGNPWEWDNFWELFHSNIHSRELPEMAKYNYLLNALKGEARESIKKFQVTKENYSKAINFLLNKYNNKEILVNHLVERLDSCTLRSHSVKDIRSLLEQVQVIVTQLKEKGEEINSSWLIKKVLAKFPDFVKRKAITKKQNQQPDVPFDMETLLTYINEILSTEEMFALFSNEDSRTYRKGPIVTKQSQGWQPSCMYCQQGHSSNRCMKYPTAQERSLYLRKNSLCLICASSEHNTASCRVGHVSDVKDFIIRPAVLSKMQIKGRPHSDKIMILHPQGQQEQMRIKSKTTEGHHAGKRRELPKPRLQKFVPTSL